MDKLHEDLIKQCEDILSSGFDNIVALDKIVSTLASSIDKYKWIGYYFFVDNKQELKQELVLGPFRGDKTDHIRIPLGVGVCGTVAKEKKSMIVDDVSKLSNYLSCSIRVRSEIVVPVLKDGEFLALIDIDGWEIGAFNDNDRIFLEKIADMIKNIIPKF